MIYICQKKTSQSDNDVAIVWTFPESSFRGILGRSSYVSGLYVRGIDFAIALPYINITYVLKQFFLEHAFITMD